MKRLDRRTFLFGTLAAPALASSVCHAAGAPDKLRLGIIGVGGQGVSNWRGVAHEEIVSLCDVDLARIGEAHELFPNAEVVQDFRRVVDRNDIDAVVVSTPDHWHAIPSVWAMQTGKHVYCEKPLAHSIHETRVMADTARRHEVVTQMGTQIHAGANYRRVVELVQAGAIGPVRRVDVWCERRPDTFRAPAAGSPPPSLDYELWTGPAPMRPFSSEIVPFHWRWWWEYGGGVLADMGCHFMDLAHWALDLRAPERVAAKGEVDPQADNPMPLEMRVDYRHPAIPNRGPVHVVWWHGTPGPRDEAGNVRDLFGFTNGVLFQGEHGELLADYGRHKLLPEEKFADYRRPDPTIPDSVGHHREWLDAIRTGGKPTCEFTYGGTLTETVLLGNAAYKLGREITWDAPAMRITNASEAECGPLLQREYRAGWKLAR
jgi:predicted dehydrogenase